MALPPFQLSFCPPEHSVFFLSPSYYLLLKMGQELKNIQIPRCPLSLSMQHSLSAFLLNPYIGFIFSVLFSMPRVRARHGLTRISFKEKRAFMATERKEKVAKEGVVLWLHLRTLLWADVKYWKTSYPLRVGFQVWKWTLPVPCTVPASSSEPTLPGTAIQLSLSCCQHLFLPSLSALALE